MKSTILEGYADSYADSPLWPRMYPRRIVCPPDYLDPKYYSAVATSQLEVPVTPNEERIISVDLARRGMPTYFLDGNFMQAVLATDPKDIPPLQELHLPLETMLIALPVSVSKEYFLGFRVPFVSYTVANNKDREGDKVLAFYAMLWPDDERPMGYYGRVPMHDTIRNLSGYHFNDNTDVEKAYMKWTLGRNTDPELHDPATRLPTPEQDHVMPDKILLYKLFMVLQTGGFITESIQERREKGKPGERKHRAALWTPNFIGKGYQPRSEYKGGTHASPRLHWRRGHTRNQPYGPNNTLKKVIWIQPTLIGAPPHE